MGSPMGSPMGSFCGIFTYAEIEPPTYDGNLNWSFIGNIVLQRGIGSLQVGQRFEHAHVSFDQCEINFTTQDSDYTVPFVIGT